MEAWLIIVVIGVILRDPAGTIKAATEYRKAAPPKSPKAKKQGAMRGYLWTVWDSQWNEATKRYPEKMAKANERRDVRRAKREAKRHKPVIPNAPTKAATPAAPAASGPKPAPAPVADLEAARRRKQAPAPRPAAAPAEPKQTAPAAGGAASTKGSTTMALDLTDRSSLGSHLAALRSYAAYWDKVATTKERLAAGMRSVGMGESTVAAVDAAGAASANAAAKARATADALESANSRVAEARAGNAEAADGSYYKRR
jgi:hypothetical protein